MNILSRDKQIEAIAALTEGVSVRATERLTGINRGTILSLGVRVGQGCAALHDRLMRDLNVSRIELDEAWSFVGKKQARLAPEDGADKGDQYVFCRVHETLRVTPALQLGVTDHIWTIGELIDAAKNLTPLPPRFRPFTVIDGGRI
jgi:hypothetical protein